MVPADARRGQDVLTLTKLAAARDCIEAVLQGRLTPSPELLVALARLVGASAHHAELAQRVAA